jgi:hypothetical protein
MNKKGDERMIFIFMMFVWIVVALAFVAGVYIFYGADTNIKLKHANVLSNRLFLCISEGGFNQKILGEEVNLFKECNINSYYFNNEHLFFARVEIFNESSGEKVKEIIIGSDSLITECNLKGRKNQFVLCTEESEFLLKDGEGKFVVKINTGSNNKGDRA